mmetsp:Transcript_29207/g.76474  ORF Transcript_29207/g.76474 Transcript_29207/m.76474 type:complete len:301 (+) Transcript_29207:729-1631(+)
MTYKSHYVWPNPAFPFRKYLETENLRVFIIENLQHNYDWLSVYKNSIRKTDFFIVILGSHWSQGLLDNALGMFDYLNLNKEQFFILFNDERDEKLFANSGLNGEIINQNAWLDYNSSMTVIPSQTKSFDAIYVGRLIKVKRHFLASDVKNLALVTGNLYGNNVEEKAPPHVYRNECQLSPDEVCKKINESCCGLILSEKEGACFASSEYLLSGIPVVSTHSEGGRSIWYDDYNSIICADDANQIKRAVEFFVDNPRDPKLIRGRHINKANKFRVRFVSLLADLFERNDVMGIDPLEFFSK